MHGRICNPKLITQPKVFHKGKSCGVAEQPSLIPLIQILFSPWYSRLMLESPLLKIASNAVPPPLEGTASLPAAPEPLYGQIPILTAYRGHLLARFKRGEIEAVQLTHANLELIKFVKFISETAVADFELKREPAFSTKDSSNVPGGNTVSALLCADCLPQVTTYLNGIFESGSSTLATRASIIRKFFEWLQTKRTGTLSPDLIQTPGKTTTAIQFPLFKEFLSANNIGKNTPFRLLRYFNFISEQINLTPKILEERTALKALKILASNPEVLQRSEINVPTGKSASLTEAVCLQAERWVPAYGQHLAKTFAGDPMAIGLAISPVRLFYRWLNKSKLTSFSPRSIINPTNKKHILPWLPIFDCWIEGQTAGTHAQFTAVFFVRKFTEWSIRKLKIEIIPAKERLAMDELKAKRKIESPALSNSVTANLIKSGYDLFRSYEESMKGNSGAPVTASRRQSAVRSFLRWAYDEGYLQIDPDIDLPQKSRRANLTRKKTAPARSLTDLPSGSRNRNQISSAHLLVSLQVSSPIVPASAQRGPLEKSKLGNFIHLDSFLRHRNTAIDLLCEQGISFSEIISYRRKNLSLDAGTILARDTSSRFSTRTLSSATAKELRLYCEEVLKTPYLKEIWHSPAGNAPLFLSADGRSLISDVDLSLPIADVRLASAIAKRNEVINSLMGNWHISFKDLISFTFPFQIRSNEKALVVTHMESARMLAQDRGIVKQFCGYIASAELCPSMKASIGIPGMPIFLSANGGPLTTDNFSGFSPSHLKKV